MASRHTSQKSAQTPHGLVSKKFDLIDLSWLLATPARTFFAEGPGPNAPGAAPWTRFRNARAGPLEEAFYPRTIHTLI